MKIDRACAFRHVPVGGHRGPTKRCFKARYFCSGATALAALMLVMGCSICITAWICLTSARVRQVEGHAIAAQRHIVWGNTRAINQQYALTWAMRDNVTRVASSASLGGWGGSDADALSGLEAFRSTVRPSNAKAQAYPFNNIRPLPTEDSGVLFARTTGDSDESQSEHLVFYNYLKTYPAPLLGDLMMVHKRPAGASGSYDISDNIRVEGRVVVWDTDATTEKLRAASCYCANPAARRTTRSLSGSSLLMPEGWGATPVVTAGYGGASKPYAIGDGTLRMSDNPDFPPGSIRHIIENSGDSAQHTGPVLGGGLLGLVGSTLGGIVNLPLLLPATSGPVVISRTYLNRILLPSAAGTTIGDIIPPLAGSTNLLNIGIVLAHHPSLPHIRMTGTIDLVIILGDLLPLNLVDESNLPPRVIWVDQDSKPRHVIFIGESNRKIIFVTGRGNGQNTYVGFLGVTQLLLGGPLKWRLQWINEFTHMTFIPPLLFSWIECTGGIRTDWSFNCTDGGSSDRLVIKRDTEPSGLETLMPRDGWLEPCVLVR